MKIIYFRILLIKFYEESKFAFLCKLCFCLFDWNAFKFLSAAASLVCKCNNNFRTSNGTSFVFAWKCAASTFFVEWVMKVKKVLSVPLLLSPRKRDSRLHRVGWTDRKMTDQKMTNQKMTDQKMTDWKTTNWKMTDQKMTDRKMTN